MKQVRVYHVDAFANQPFNGNTAGVIPDAGTLTVTEMQKIANELNLPESAFLMPSDHPEADFRIRYFTPTVEINFCGHATVGSAWLLATEMGWLEKTDRIMFETNVGLIPVKLETEDGRLQRVTMTQIAPAVKEIDVDGALVARLVGIEPEDINESYPIKLASTGGWHLLVPVKSRAAIDCAEPLLTELAAMNSRYGITTTHLFTPDAPQGYDFYTRDFAPAIGIPEDPVTGAANGALAGYLALQGFLAPDADHQLTVGQGDAIGRPGTLYISVSTRGEEPLIRVAGEAHVTIAGQLRLSSAY